MELLRRNIETLLPSKKDFEELLALGKPLRVKLGIDPTGPNIHIGNAVALWKLREFQDMGHKIVLIFGDFTARIGDPSDKDKRRPVLTKEEIDKNVASYISQIRNIVDVKKIELHHNSEWHDALTQADLIKLSRLLTVNQMLARRNFSERVKEKKEIGIDEFLYPLLQGYDSVAIRSDIELGGTDQLFNLEVGRIIQEAYGQKPQLIMTTKMLWGLDGKKMSKSWGNVVNINDEPSDMFGKIMSLDDSSVSDYFELATALPLEKIREIEGITHIKEQKELLAHEITARYHGEEKAQKAKEEFTRLFLKKEIPHNIESKIVLLGGTPPAILVETGLAPSISEAKRLIEQKGVKFNGEIVDDNTNINEEGILQVGKRKFLRLISKQKSP